MMMSEFIDRTGLEPTAKEFAEIEKVYYNFGGDKTYTPNTTSFDIRTTINNSLIFNKFDRK